MYHFKLKQSEKLSLTAAALLNLNLGCEQQKSIVTTSPVPTIQIPAPTNPTETPLSPESVGVKALPDPVGNAVEKSETATLNSEEETNRQPDAALTEEEESDATEQAEAKINEKANEKIKQLEARLKDLEQNITNNDAQHNNEQEETKQLLASFKEILKDSDKRKLTINQKIRYHTTFKLGNLCNSKKDIEAKILAIEREIQENEKIIDDIASSKQKNKFKAQKLKKIFNKLYEQEYQKKYLEKLLDKKKEKSGKKNEKLQAKLATIGFSLRMTAPIPCPII